MIDTEILEDYSSEARELLDEMDHSLMRLEKEGPVPELLNNVFRAVHCIKGSAQYIGLESSSTLTHGVENLLDRLREGMLTLDPTIMEFLFRSKDLISTLIEEVANHRAEKSDISAMMEQLDSILQRPARPAAEPVHTSTQSPESPLEEASEPDSPAGYSEPEVLEANILGPDDTDALESEDAGILESDDLETADELREYTASLRKETGGFDDDLLGAEEEALYEPMSYVVREYDEAVLEETQPPAFFSMADMEQIARQEEEAIEKDAEEPSEPVAEFETEALPEVAETLETESPLEATVPHLLTISLYLDDFQDGFFHPSEIVPSLLETIEVVRDSFELTGMDDAAGILETFKTRLAAVDPDQESMSHDEIEGLRSLLFSLRQYYPPDLFPLGDRELPPVAPVQAPPEAPVSRPLPVPESAPVPPAAFAVEPEASYSPAEEETLPQSSPGARGVHEESPAVIQAMEPAAMGPISAGESQRSLLADVDDELLSQFENEFESMFASHQQATKIVEMAVTPIQVGGFSDLAEGLDIPTEESDREIIEIFLAYGLEIMEKLRPLVTKTLEGRPIESDLDSCAEFINSIRSSATYMDYQKLAAFLDDWYENTRAVAERSDSVTPRELAFMGDNYNRFQDFLRDLQRALNPQAAPAQPAPAKVAPVKETAVEAIPSPPPVAQEPEPVAPKPIARPESTTPPPVSQPALEAPVLAMRSAPVKPEPAEPPAPARPPAETRVEPPTAPAEVPPAPALVEESPRLTAERTESEALIQSATAQEAYPARESQEGAVVKTMRVDSAKVDTLLNQVGELVVNRSYVEQLSLELRSFHRSLMTVGQVSKKEVQSIKDLALKIGEASIALGRVATDIQEGVMKLRMLPVGQLFNRMPRLIRDLSRRVGKVVNLEVHGADTEVDKRVIEQIYNPLVHLIRNAVDHGIEDREARKKQGKTEEGLIVLRAYSQGNQVSIDVEDDGAGVDKAAVLAKAVEHRLIDQGDASNVSQQDIFNFLFAPGFSTSKSVTRTSGRGVGMDVVKKDVEKINGHVDIESWENEGTRISIKIPLTLAIIQTLLIRSVKHVFAIPLTSVREIIQVSQHEITTIEGFEVIKFREETIPVLRINEVFHLKSADASRQARFLVLTTAGPRTVGFLVEELIGEQDVVIKPLADHVFKNRGLAGSTILGDGTIALVLDVTELIDDIIAQQRQFATQAARQALVDAQLEMNHSLEM